MTATSSLGGPVSLDEVARVREVFLAEGAKGFPVVAQVAQRRGNSDHREGEEVLRPNGRRRKFTKRLFDNQVTVIFRTREATYVNAKVFRTGSVQLTGARTVESARDCVRLLARLLAVSHEPEVAVRLINADADLGFAIDRERLYRHVRETDRVRVTFQPEVQLPVKVGFFSNASETGRCQSETPCEGKHTDCCKKVTVMVFHTGKAIFTGALTTAQIDQAYDYIRTAAPRARIP